MNKFFKHGVLTVIILSTAAVGTAFASDYSLSSIVPAAQIQEAKNAARQKSKNIPGATNKANTNKANTKDTKADGVKP